MMWIRRIYCGEEQGAEGGAGTGSAGAVADAPAEGLSSDLADDDSEVNWEGLDNDFDALDVEGDQEIIGDGQPAAPVVSPSVAPAPAVTPPVSTAPIPPAAAAAPPAVQTPQSAPPPQSQGSQPAAQTAAPEAYGSWRQARVTELEQHYTFSEDESAALLSEPELVLPKLAAKVHMEVLENSMRAMQAMVPVMLEQIKTHTEVNTSARSLFTSINPDLADPSYEPAIMQLGMAYRQMNRSAGAEEASRAIGNLVRAALNMAPGAPAAAPVGGSLPPAAPVTPFVPMRGGGGGQRPAVSSNQFEQFASELLSEEDNY